MRFCPSGWCVLSGYTAAGRTVIRRVGSRSLSLLAGCYTSAVNMYHPAVKPLPGVETRRCARGKSALRLKVTTCLEAAIVTASFIFPSQPSVWKMPQLPGVLKGKAAVRLGRSV